MIEVTGQLTGRCIDLVVLDQATDTTTPAGRLTFHVLAAIAEFVRDLTRERIADGLAAAKIRHGGRLPAPRPVDQP
jgi:DNA invertase Pin-like site-specific DNA recombinase